MRLTRDSHPPILPIALDAGFKSLSSFNKVFKDIHGRTAADYRLAPDPKFYSVASVRIEVPHFASKICLDFFADRLPLPGLIIVVAGMPGILLSWGIVFIHAVEIARTNPIHALRYE